MGIYNVHAGHCPQGQGAFGAVGVLQESVEDRLVKDEVIRLLREQGHTVYDCTCDLAVSASECLKEIVKKCNQHKVELDVSIHLNSGRGDLTGDGNIAGTEVYNFSEKTKAVSDRICANISVALGIKNRGTKYNKDLYVLRHTNSPAILVECCFVDDKDDADRWDPKKCAQAIVAGILDQAMAPGEVSKPVAPAKPVEPPKPVAPARPQSAQKQIVADGYWGKDTTIAAQKFFGTDPDGIVSRQNAKNKKYLKNATGGWQFMNEYKDFKKGSWMIKELQKYIGLSGNDVDGIAGKTTVVYLQRFLVKKGYSIGKSGVDGYMGKDTVTAWQRFLNDWLKQNR